MNKIFKIFIFIYCFFVVSVNAELITLDNYLDLVLKNNSELKSIQSNIDAVKGKLAQIEMAYSYSLSAGVSYSDDKSGRPFSLAARPDDIKSLACDATISKMFGFGTQVSFGLNGSHTNSDFMNGALNLDVIDIAPFIKLQQSLLKDINGGSTKASIAKAKASAKSALYLLEYQKQNVLLNAKMAYWNLSYAKTVIDFRKNALNRVEKILDWNQKRFNMDLAEKSDLLQSQAAVKLGNLNLKVAYEQENKANRTFNQFLSIADVIVKYDVEKFEDKGQSFNSDYEPEKKSMRLDVCSSLEDANSALYDQIANKKTSGADLVLNGQFALNGVDQDFEFVKNNLTKGERPSYSLGIRYSLPLSFKLRKTLNQGYEAAKISAQKKAEYLSIKENNDWQQLLDDWNDAKLKNALAVEIEQIQKQRKQEDEKLLKTGRTTTYLVLQTEQALDDATLNVFGSILELIKIFETAKAFYSYNLEVKVN
ncbi:MAG: TolC family protein [Endomicrobium sp.]|jgi:outer membrane protein TolC|nr:TolC family protein [Endomicrobium sp.]